MSIQATVSTAQPSWKIDLGALGATAPVGGAAQPAPVVQQQPAATNTWGSWNGKGQIYDYAYDAYVFSKFPLNIGGSSFWTGGPIRRGLVSMFSKVSNERLVALDIRNQFMKLPGMDADSARLLEMAYTQASNGKPATANKAPLRWLAQFGGGGSLNDWLVRGPLVLTLGILSAQVGVDFGFLPSVPGMDKLRELGDAALRVAPPAPTANSPY